MNFYKTATLSARIYLGFCAFCLAYLSLLSLANPQATMDFVQVELTNNDAISSIRGIYGGVGLSITVAIVYLLFKDIRMGLGFLILFWGAYAISRLITLIADGPLGDFGSQWLLMESVFCVLAVGLYAFYHRSLAPGA